jgi:hypothetical protein
MIRRSFPNEWDTSQLPSNRRVHLDSGLSFEEIVAQMMTETRVTRVRIKPFETPARGEPKDARQAIFHIRVDQETCNPFYNAPDGIARALLAKPGSWL